MLFSLLKHYLELFITDTALKVSISLYCLPTSISHGVENFFPRLCGVRASLLFVTPEVKNLHQGCLVSPYRDFIQILLFYFKRHDLDLSQNLMTSYFGQPLPT